MEAGRGECVQQRLERRRVVREAVQAQYERTVAFFEVGEVDPVGVDAFGVHADEFGSLCSMAAVTLEPVRDGVTLLTLNRPDSLNAMNHGLVAGVHDALDEVDNDQSCRVVVLTGAGRAFCAGLDLKGSGVAPGTDGVGRAQAGMLSQQHIASLYTHMRRVRKPITAGVNGPAAGGGFGL